MRQVLLCVSVLLLGLTWSVAQTGGSSDTSSGSSGQYSGSASSGQTGASGQMDHSKGGHTTVEGCLSGSNGNFTLTDKQGNSYQLTGDTAKLSEHVGHEIKVTGSADTSTGGGTTTSDSTGAGASQTLQVMSVKHVSKTCQSGSSGTMNH